ncbi:hypothetical protein PIB30_110654, partial [Stylosanthes scabra]|nr:hypothetical protein [Stylosanthes scabra]
MVYINRIINSLKMLGKTFTEEEILDKVLWSLTPKWDSKITAIEEGRNFNTLTYDQLRGNLIASEVKYLNNNQVEEEKKKKGLALKASSLQEEEDELEDFEDDDEELAFLLKRFNRLAQRKNLKFKNKSKQPPKCYGCGEVGHIKPNCPKAPKEDKEKKFKKIKAYISWENEESESSDEDENANICLMAKGDE